MSILEHVRRTTQPKTQPNSAATRNFKNGSTLVVAHRLLGAAKSLKGVRRAQSTEETGAFPHGLDAAIQLYVFPIRDDCTRQELAVSSTRQLFDEPSPGRFRRCSEIDPDTRRLGCGNIRDGRHYLDLGEGETLPIARQWRWRSFSLPWRVR
jgi:hypothetical protein